jgi:hypothetical protein
MDSSRLMAIINCQNNNLANRLLRPMGVPAHHCREEERAAPVATAYYLGDLGNPASAWSQSVSSLKIHTGPE